MNIDKAEKLVAQLKHDWDELHSLLEEAEQTAATTSLPLLARWRVTWNEAVKLVKEAKSALGGQVQKVDRVLVTRMLEADDPTFDVGDQRLYADMRGFFTADAGAPAEFFTPQVDQKKLDEYCERTLRAGSKLPIGVKSHLIPVVRFRRIGG